MPTCSNFVFLTRAEEVKDDIKPDITPYLRPVCLSDLQETVTRYIIVGERE